jgi:hypothetical protein
MAEAAREVGATADIEPNTGRLLNDEYTDAELKGMVPKVANKAAKLRAEELASTFKALASMVASDTRVPALMRKIKDALATVDVDTKGVRLDLEIVLTDGRTILCDFTGIHPTTVASLRPLRTFIRAHKLGEQAVGGAELNNPMARQASPAVVAATKVKLARYNMLMELLGRQVRARKRTVMPLLVPGVVTHLGELGPAMIGLMETLTGVAGTNFRRGPETMGLTRTKVTAIYRTRLKDAVLCVNAAGFGQALMAAGNPIPGWAMAPDEMDLPAWDIHNY